MTSYALATSYSGQGLIDNFNFVSFADPTFGFVAYQNYTSAVSAGLVSVDASTNAVKLSVDTTNTYATDGSQGGRPSVRIESIAAVNQGLVIGDFSHMPGSVCGAWPAFWMYGPNWPNDGEVDIIEGANSASYNLMSAHTSADCVLPSAGFTGTEQYLDCSDTTYGCNFVPPTSDTSSYGTGFNAVGGGVYALQWTDDAIGIWHFPRTGIPQDILDKQPDPSGWGLPQALFGSTGCDVSSHFENMNIVLNIDLCGSYAGKNWASDAQCSGYAATCVDWVANNPQALTEAYWEVNYIDVYGLVSTTPAPSTAPGGGTASQAPSAGGSITPTGTTAASSTPSSPLAPVDSVVPVHDPATIGAFSYQGCYASSSGFSSFDLGGTDPSLTLEKCVALCNGKVYAGAVDTSCYCANTLDVGTSAIQNRASCGKPCPGNSTEYCGGSLPSSKRAALPPSVLLTMYANINALNSATPPPPAPALGANTTNITSSSSTRRAPSTSSTSSVGLGSVATATAVQTITSTITYTDICSTNPAQLVTLTYCTTITVCPTSTPSIPLTTITQSCAACGQNGSSIVTLTVPCDVAATRTNYYYGVATATVVGTGAATVTANGAVTGSLNTSVPVPVPTTSLRPVTAAAAARGSSSGLMVALIGFVGMLV